MVSYVMSVFLGKHLSAPEVKQLRGYVNLKLNILCTYFRVSIISKHKYHQILIYSIFIFQTFVNKLKLTPGMKVLDIGCGTGGSAFYLAKHYGVEVLGVDLSQNMLDIANEHKQKLFDENVRFNVTLHI